MMRRISRRHPKIWWAHDFVFDACDLPDEIPAE
jgi:hypothetical protein